MQILTITSSTNRSGGTRQAIYQTQEFAKRGYNAKLCLPYNSTFWELPKKEQDPLWIALPENRSKQKIFIEKLLSDTSPTIIHVFHNKAIKRIAWWGLSWKYKNVTCVAHRGVIYRPKNPLPYLSPAIKAFIPNSKACAKSLRWHCPSKKIYVVPNGLPAERSTPTISQEEALKHIGISYVPKFLFGFVGNNKPQKGFDILLEAFSKAHIADAHLLTMGVKEEYWRPLCEQFHITEQVHFLDHVEHISNYLQLCDAFIVPSRAMESSPNTLIEAMCMGLPIIATNAGGIPELVKGNGIIVPVADAKSMANALTYMRSNPAQREEWSKQSCLLSQQYSITTRCDTLEGIYHKIGAWSNYSNKNN